jgi:hypothetical protein
MNTLFRFKIKRLNTIDSGADEKLLDSDNKTPCELDGLYLKENPMDCLIF